MLVVCKYCGQTFNKSDSECKRSSNHFCSKSCAAKYNNKQFPKRQVEGECKVCKKSISTRKTFCTDCNPQVIINTVQSCLNCHNNFYLKYQTQKFCCSKCRNSYGQKLFRKQKRLEQLNKTIYYKSLTLKQYHERESVYGKHPSWRNSHIRGFNRSWNSDLCKQSCQRCGYALHIELAHIKPICTFNEMSTLLEINSPQNILVLCRNCHWEFDNGILALEEIPSRISS